MALGWPLPKNEEPEAVVVNEIDDVSLFETNLQQTLVLTEGWVDGPVAAVLRGGNNAKAILEVLANSGVKEIIIYHLEEKIPELEEIFLATVVSEANRLFEKARIFWRNDASIYELVRAVGKDYRMLFFGAPLAKSEIAPFYNKLKGAYSGKVAIVRGPVCDFEFAEGDEIFNWVRKRTFEAEDFSLPAVLRSCKKRLELKSALILPTLNEEKTIAQVIETALEVKRAGLFDEVILIDSASQDDTVAIARQYSIPIHQHSEIAWESGSFTGKGEAMFKSGLVTQADIIAWVDTDIENITPTFFYGLLGPIYTNPQIKFVKGYFERPVRIEASGVELGGGRVTEILARPWINTFFPKLAGFIQPLAGTVAIYRELFSKMKIPTNYGVEMAMLIQAVQSSGLWSTSQVNLGEVIHKSKDVTGLSEMAFQILQVLKNFTEGCNSELNGQDPVLRHVFSGQGDFSISTKRFITHWRQFPEMFTL